MFTGCGGAYRTHSRMHRHKVLKSSCNRNADISCAYRRAYADRDGFPPDSTLVVFFQSVAANDRTRSTLQQTRFSTRSSPPSTAFVEFQYLRAHAHVHTRLRCRCSFESFRDNSSRQINLFSPRSNLFQPYVKHVFTLVSRVDRCSIRRWKSSCHAGNVYIFPSELRDYDLTTFSPRFFFFDFRDHAFPLLSFGSSSLPLSSRNTRAPRKNRSLIGTEGIPIVGVVRFASATSSIASKGRITVRTKRNGGE